MKFRTIKDKHLFLAELNRTDLLGSVTEEWYPEESLLVEFISGRNSIIPKLKNFRQSQNQKANWRTNRYKIMRGIKSFHKSTEGKAFHRNLGRYLATRMTQGDKGHQKRERLMSYDERFEALKALSSLRTHLYIEKHFYQPMDEQLELEAFMDELIPLTLTEELQVYNDNPIEYQEEYLDILCRAIVVEDLVKEYCYAVGVEFKPGFLVEFDKHVAQAEKSYPEILKEIIK